MNTEQMIKALQELDPSGEMKIGYEGVAITHPYIEKTLPISYIDDEIKFHIDDEMEWININTVSYKDFLLESNGEIILDLKDSQNKWILGKEVYKFQEKLRQEEKETIKELTFDILQRLKDGYKITQGAESSSMFFCKDEKEISLSAKECKAVISSLFFNHEGNEWKLTI